MKPRLLITAAFSIILTTACGGGGGGSQMNSTPVTPPTPTSAPVITQAPTNTTVQWGQTATFTATATGNPTPTLTWRCAGATAGTGNTFQVVATTSTLVDVRASNSVGSVLSNPVTLYVTDATPTIISTTPSQTVARGQAVKLTVNGGGGNLNYMWIQNGQVVGTDASYNFTASSTATFNVRLLNSMGSITSSDIVVTVTDPPMIVTQPQNQSSYVGGTATFQVAATGSPTPNYQWKCNGANVGTNSPSYTTPVLSMADNGETYTVTVSNSTGSVTSSPATLMVAAPSKPNITQQPQDQTKDFGETATFTVTASGGSVSYQWTKNGINVGSNSNTYSVVLTRADIGAKIYVTASNSVGSTQSNVVTLNAVAPTMDLSIAKVRFNQCIQVDDDSVPLISNRTLSIQVFPLANKADALRPQVQIQVQIQNGTSVVQTLRQTVSCPTAFDITNDLNHFDFKIDGSSVVNGYSYSITIDPDDLINETNENNNTVTGTFNTITTPKLFLEVVPLIVGGLSSQLINEASFQIKENDVRSLLPISNDGLDLIFSSSYQVTSINDSNPPDSEWWYLLQEVEAKRLTENNGRHYIGCINETTYDQTHGATGCAIQPGKTLIIRDNSDGTVVHELGHNFNRYHNECEGKCIGSDPSYPYPDGVVEGYAVNYYTISGTGYYMLTGTRHDIMGYCRPSWISDYIYKGILNYRQSSPSCSATNMSHETNTQSSLLIWGSWNAKSGEWTLEPTFTLGHFNNTEDDVSGSDLMIHGLDKSGKVVLQKEFKLNNLADDETGGHRSFALRINTDLDLSEIQIVENGKVVASQKADQSIEEPSMTYNTSKTKIISHNNKAVMVMNEKGEVISIIRNASKTAILEAEGKKYILHVSNGTGSKKFERNF